jgi:hypothetical protein
MMRRWLIIAAVVALLVAVGAWIAQRVYWEEVSIPTPLKGEARTNPFYSAQRLVEALGGRSERRDTLGTLPPPHDAVIVLTYWHWSLLETRRKQLEAWIEAGGRVVFDSTIVGGEQELADWIGVAREHASPEEEIPASEEGAEAEDEADVEAEDAATDEEEEGENCYALEVSHGGSPLNPVGGFYTVCNMAEASWLTSARAPLWALHDGEDFQAVRVAAGRGSVTLLNAQPFGNRDLLKPDHARLFADAARLRPGDLVVFVSAEEHASLLALIWRYGAPVVLLTFALIGAALWRGGVRFGPMEAPPELSRRSLAEQIRGAAQFVVRAGGGRALHGAIARAVHEAAQRRIPGYMNLPQAERVGAIVRLTGADGERLSAALQDNEARRMHDLKRDIALLDAVRAQLTHLQSGKREYAD